MNYCWSCGHQLGVGRFCTNCGQPVDRVVPRSTTSPDLGGSALDDTAARGAAAPHPPAAPSPAPAAPDDRPGPDTAERRAARLDAAMSPGPARTPPAADVPPPARFPLFVDEVPPVRSDPWTTRTDVAWTGTTDPRDDDTGSDSLLAQFSGADRDVRDGRDGRGRGRRDDEGDEGDEGDAGLALARLRRAAADGPDVAVAVPHRRHRRWPWLLLVLVLLVALGVAAVVWQRTRGGGATDDAAPDTPPAVELVTGASVEVPDTAPPSQEVGGGEVTYDAAHLLDGDPTTAWRVAGDASGDRITLTFPERVTVAQVGLVNGYAKKATDARGRTLDWYHGHRTLTRVVWIFDDGTEVRQDLREDREPQLVDVDERTTRRLTLRIAAVSAPGTGRAGRDFTAISDLTVLGATG